MVGAGIVSNWYGEIKGWRWTYENALSEIRQQNNSITLFGKEAINIEDVNTVNLFTKVLQDLIKNLRMNSVHLLEIKSLIFAGEKAST